MRRFLKWLGIIIIILCCLLLVGVFTLTSIKPDWLKPVIVSKVHQYTGRDFEITGNISWKFFPLGIKAEGMRLANAPGFKDKVFAEAKDTVIKLKFLPLLSRRVEITGIDADEFKLFLYRKADGMTNWQDLQKNQTLDTEDSTWKSRLAVIFKNILIKNINLTNSTIQFVDEKNHTKYVLTHFAMQANGIQTLTAFPFKLSFDFVGDAVSGNFALASDVSFDKQDNLIADGKLDLDTTLKLKNAKKRVPFKITSDVVLNIDQDMLKLDAMQGNVANMTFNGRAVINSLLEKPQLHGNLQMPPFDARQWLIATGQGVPAIQELKNLSGNFELKTKNNFDYFDLRGKVKITNFRLADIILTDITSNAHFDDDSIELTGINGNIFNGRVRGDVKINTKGTNKYSIDAMFTNLKIEPIMDYMAKDSKLKLSGVGTLNLDITMVGENETAMLRSLNGRANFKFKDGSIKGIDMLLMFYSAYALINQQNIPKRNAEETKFSNFSASVQIRNGVMTNQDLVMDASAFQAQGSGIIDLARGQINYRLQSTAKRDNSQQQNNFFHLLNLYGTVSNPANLLTFSQLTVPIVITGDLSKPHIALDMKAMAPQLAAMGITTFIKAGLTGGLIEILPGGQAVQLISTFGSLLSR